MSIKKRSNLVKVMKSAISVSKSQTGDTVFRVNKKETRNKRHNLLAVERMQTYTQITLDHSTRLFERKKRKLIKFHNDHSVPEPIRLMQSRYDELKEQIKSRQVSMWNNASDAGTKLPELSSALTERLKREPQPMVTQSLPASLRGHTGTTTTSTTVTMPERNVQERIGRTMPRHQTGTMMPQRVKMPERRTQVVTRDSLRKPTAPQPPAPQLSPVGKRYDWCDKERIHDFFLNQNQTQEAMYFKLHLDRWNTMMTEKEKALNEKYPGEENHLYSVELSKRSHGDSSSDWKADVSHYYSRNSNHGSLHVKPVDFKERKIKTKIPPISSTFSGEKTTKKYKNKGFECNKSVTFVE